MSDVRTPLLVILFVGDTNSELECHFLCLMDPPHLNIGPMSTVDYKPIEHRTENLGIHLGVMAADARFFLALDGRWCDATCLSLLF